MKITEEELRQLAHTSSRVKNPDTLLTWWLRRSKSEHLSVARTALKEAVEGVQRAPEYLPEFTESVNKALGVTEDAVLDLPWWDPDDQSGIESWLDIHFPHQRNRHDHAPMIADHMRNQTTPAALADHINQALLA